MDVTDAWENIRKVEAGEAPSGSLIVAVTGPNSLMTPGGAPAHVAEEPEDNDPDEFRMSARKRQVMDLRHDACGEVLLTAKDVGIDTLMRLADEHECPEERSHE